MEIILQINQAVDNFYHVVVPTVEFVNKNVHKFAQIVIAKNYVITLVVLFLLLIHLPLISQVNILLRILGKLIIHLHIMNLLNIEHQIILKHLLNQLNPKLFPIQQLIIPLDHL